MRQSITTCWNSLNKMKALLCMPSHSFEPRSRVGGDEGDGRQESGMVDNYRENRVRGKTEALKLKRGSR